MSAPVDVLAAIDAGIIRLVQVSGLKTGERTAHAVDELRSARHAVTRLIAAVDNALAAGVSDLAKLDAARRELAAARDVLGGKP